MDSSIQHMDLIFYENNTVISHSTLITNLKYPLNTPGKSMF